MKITRQDPPPKKSWQNRTHLVRAAIEVVNDGMIGEWYKIKEYSNRMSAISVASQLRNKQPHDQWPNGYWEIVGRENPEGTASVLFFKYNGPADSVIIENKPRRGVIVKQSELVASPRTMTEVDLQQWPTNPQP